MRLFQSLDGSSLILTPNQRLSRYLHANYAQFQVANKLESWPSLACLPRSAWFRQLWQQVQLNGSHPHAAWYVLNNLQEQQLWHSVSQELAAPWPLLAPQQLEKLAADAWRTLRLWRISLAQLEANWSQLEEVQLLSSWIRAYEAQRMEQQLLDPVALQTLLPEALQGILNPQKIYLYGFEKPEPLFSHFLTTLGEAGCEIHEVHISDSETQKARCYIATDPETGLRHAARWAAALNERKPQARIAVVIPELSVLQDQVERVVNEVFNPQFNRTAYPRHAPVVNISAAKELASTPPIAAALRALNLNRFELEVEDIGAVLQSIFIGDESSLLARDIFLAQLKADHQKLRTTRLRALLAEAAEEQPELKPVYEQYNNFFALMRNKQGAKFSAEEWMQIFQQQLQALNWPGSRTPDTLEYQQLVQWQQVLQNFMSLDVCTPPLTLEQALTALKQAAAIPFHVQSEDSPIQVLGLLEAAGMHFDYLWLAQMDELHWPPAPAPNPLLPLALQIQQAMPRASHEGELAYAQALMRTLRQNCGEIIFSWALQGQNEELQASPLVQDVAVTTHLELIDAPLCEPAQLEEITDDQANPLEKQYAHGGTHILRDFAACPFKAFARYRLHAQTLDEKRSGIDPITRGNLIHQSLDNLWHRLQNQNALLALTEAEEQQLVSEVVDAAWRKVTGKLELSSHLQALEIERSCKLLHNWLQLEKQRSDFKVQERERGHQTRVGAMQVQMRYDRVDELDDGSLVVIDYKTSPWHSISQWASERPDEPQVPLYALANASQVSAAAFALVSARKSAFEGLQKQNGIAPGLKLADDPKQKSLPASWDEVLTHWENVLSQLANRWLQGDAAVDPKHPRQTCERCDLHALCRIREKLAYREEDDDSD